ncbi:MAG TPA: zf-HC2 domain-containing protein [Longimicrobiales bacterium]|nr:zf-HC2 domain-containing protein [Longimicrobiales bacterium]
MSVQDSGRSRDMTCDEILAAHSDYLDGLLPAHEAARVQWHLASCQSCGRYDRIVRRGTGLVRELTEVEPSDDFTERLQHRLYHVQDAAALASSRTGGPGVAATVAVAGVLAIMAWSPLMLRSGVMEPGTAVVMDSGTSESAPAQPGAMPDLTADYDDVWGAGLIPMSAPAIMSLRGGDAVQTLASYPGPYSPLVVTPPVQRTVRTISID